MEQLPIVTFASELYEAMLAQWLRSVPDDCRPVVHRFSADPVTYAQGRWHLVVAGKLDLILDHIIEAPGSLFVFSDVDIQFFGPIAADLWSLMGERDVLFQHDRGARRPAVLEWLCAGFMVIRATPAARGLFTRARDYLYEQDNPALDDQGALRVVAGDDRIARLDLLPPRYWTHGRMGWTPGQAIDPPADILMHHANWIIGNEAKLAQLAAVRQIVEGRR